MNRHIDQKVTMWRRIEIPDGVEVQEVIDNINKEKYPDAFNIMEDITYPQKISFYTELIAGTEIPMSTEENQGACTIEYYEGTDMIWNNKQQYKV